NLADLAFVRAGLLKGRRVMELLSAHFGDICIEDLPVAFHALAADLVTGDEVLLSEGPVVDALRASISLPWIFEPVARGQQILVDGGMRAPVPMGAARRLGATHLIAVHVAGDHLGRIRAAQLNLEQHSSNKGSKIAALAFALQSDAVVDAQRELAMPDIFLEPAAGGLEMHAFLKARELIAIGRAAAEAQRDRLAELRERLLISV
ncbi:MAG: patatin-like phospholipase family protein, partial [Sandaracinobacteroides sp.]